MPYAPLQSLIDRYGEGLLIQLTDRAEPPAGAIDAAVVAQAQAAADGVIDAHLQDRYALPLASVPPVIADLAAALVIWRLHRYSPDPKIAADHEAAMRTLVNIAKGTVRLALAGVAVPGTGTAGVRITDRQRPFTEENLKGFV